MKKFYLVQIFQVGIPAGVQSTVINISNALLQSSVNSFGSTAMAGYTAANNILGFLYASVNAVTQACMSFTSQNYGVGKYKRMDRVLLDCGILSFVIALVLGCGSYMLGGEILKIYTEDPEVIRCGVGDPFHHHGALFLMWNHGSFSWRSPGEWDIPVCL